MNRLERRIERLERGVHVVANIERPGVSVEKIFPRLGETDTTDNVPKMLKEARC
jgi:hypothetical protein